MSSYTCFTVPEYIFLQLIRDIHLYQKHKIVNDKKVEDYIDIAAFNIIRREYKKNAVNKKIIFNLSNSDFKKLTKSKCHYCGKSPHNIRYTPNGKRKYTFNGIDRKNNDEGYVIDNCVSCCKACNYAKWKHKEKTFLNHVEKIYTKRFNE